MDGNDTIYGEAGNATLYGADGNDWLFGNADGDILRGVNGAQANRETWVNFDIDGQAARHDDRLRRHAHLHRQRLLSLTEFRPEG